MKFGTLNNFLHHVKPLIVFACSSLFCLMAHAELPINEKTIQQLINATDAAGELEKKYPNFFDEEDGTNPLVDGGAALAKKVAASPASADANKLAQKNGFSDFEEMIKFSAKVMVAHMAASSNLSQLEAMVVEQKKAMPAMQEYYKSLGEDASKAQGMIADLEAMVNAIKSANPKDVAAAQKYSALLKPIVDAESDEDFDDSESQRDEGE